MKKTYSWAIVGAGAAGIAVIGKLLDQGIKGADILWVDPSFESGDLGKLWRNVSSNTTVELFHKFFEVVDSFDYPSWRTNFQMQNENPSHTCQLGLVADLLSEITKTLKGKVATEKGFVKNLSQGDRTWKLHTAEGIFESENVVLATGAEPSVLPFVDKETIPMQVAMDADRLKKAYAPDETVAVFGASHSAVIVIRYLIEQGAKRVINFYQGPLRFAVPQGDWILFDNTGLKGNTAIWAKENLFGKLPKALERHHSNSDNINTYLPQCDKVVQAVGFHPRIPNIEGYPDCAYNNKTGIIAPGLFGFGIAFPEQATDRAGNVELRVGLWKFIDYLMRVMPIWMQYGMK